MTFGQARRGQNLQNSGGSISASARSIALRASIAATIWALVGQCAWPSLAQAQLSPGEDAKIVVTGSAVETDGMLESRDVRRLRRSLAVRRDPQKPQGDDGAWLMAYLSHMFDAEPAVVQRRRAAAKVLTASAAPRATPLSRKPAPLPVATPAALAAVSKPVPPSSIVTGAVAVPRVAAPVTPEMQDAIIVAAERNQARVDLVKLELASRTYDERKLSGQQVFELRIRPALLQCYTRLINTRPIGLTPLRHCVVEWHKLLAG